MTPGYDPANADRLASIGVKMYTDSDEWSSYSSVKEDPVLHIELRKWADAMVIAPCSANTLAKLASGLADNLLVRH